MATPTKHILFILSFRIVASFLLVAGGDPAVEEKIALSDHKQVSHVNLFLFSFSFSRNFLSRFFGE
jgi:hypothetical protein